MPPTYLAAQNPFTPEQHTVPTNELVLGTVAINILALALPIMTLQLYDRVLPNPGSGTLPVLLTGVCIALTLETILRLVRGRLLLWSGAAWEHRVSCAAMEHFMYADISATQTIGIGAQIGRMSAIRRLKDFYNGYTQTVWCELAFVPIFLALIAYIAGFLVFVPISILLVFIAISMAYGQALRQTLNDRDIADDTRYSYLVETLEGIHTLKSLGAEQNTIRKYESLEEISTLNHYDVSKRMGTMFNTGAIFSNLMLTAVICGGALMVLQGHMSSGALVATILLSGRVMQPVQRALALWTRYQDFQVAQEKAATIFNTPLVIPSISNPDDHTPMQGRLDAQRLSFKTHNSDIWLFQNANLHINPGDVLSLIGPRGSGKTTLLEIIAGIYPPTSGTLRIDDRDAYSFSPEERAQHVGYIATEGVIFRGTVRDNLTAFGLIPEEKVREIAHLLGVDADISRLPAGFDTFLYGNTSDTLSPGLRQRIAIVRALAPKPRLILFDNADRALDNQGYNLVYRLLARLKGKASMIIVSDDKNMRALSTHYALLQDTQLITTTNPTKP